MQILKYTKHRPRFYRLRIWICYIFIYFHDFYAAKLKLSEIEEWAVNFVMNRKKLGCQNFQLPSWMCLFQPEILSRFRLHFPKNACFFSKAIDTLLETFIFPLTKFEKIFWDQEDFIWQEIWRTSIHLFKVGWNDHLVNYFPLMYRYGINTNILHLTFSRAEFWSFCIKY